MCRVSKLKIMKKIIKLYAILFTVVSPVNLLFAGFNGSCKATDGTKYGLTTSSVSPGGLSRVCVNEYLTFSATVDADEAIPDSPTYAWRFTAVDASSSTNVNGQTTYGDECSASFAWDTPGIYKVQFKAVDEFTTGYTCETTLYEFTVVVVKIEINSVSIENNSVNFKLYPEGVVAGATIKLNGAFTTHVVLSESVTADGTNQISKSLDRNSIPEGEYMSISIEWCECSASLNYHFRALGVYLHSQYNIPTESDCTGSPTSVYITTESCNFSSVFFKSDFKAKVVLNGSGVSINYGNVGREWTCISNDTAPDDAANDNSFRKNMPSFTNACGNNNLNNSTVAVRADHPYLSCGNAIYISGVGSKTVTDHGSLGGNYRQCDNFTNNGACYGITDLGNYSTFVIY